MNDSSRPDAPRRFNTAILVLLQVVLVLAFALASLLIFRPNAATGGLAAREQAALTAAEQVSVNLMSYRRADFNADFARAVSGTTAPLTAQLQAEKQTLLGELTQGKNDATANLSAGAVAKTQPTPDSIVALVVVDAFSVSSSGTSTLVNHSRLQLTMQDVKGKWLASNFETIGLV
ncbi:MAG TPA: hypothetical protein VK816_06865 [Jatrophihabitantaceae bacterium]|jgi:hypothetical protein|nr:hypothetical protein [Jatrophihabitantaceae bacterium]